MTAGAVAYLSALTAITWALADPEIALCVRGANPVDRMDKAVFAFGSLDAWSGSAVIWDVFSADWPAGFTLADVPSFNCWAGLV
ncbi:MAG: hypothetical protein ACJAVM_002406 [Sulfitobacter sp.]|jgi:hypothetical protein